MKGAAVTNEVVTARPQLLTRVGWACAAFVFATFVVIALVMKHANAGATFGDKDQVATALLHQVTIERSEAPQGRPQGDQEWWHHRRAPLHETGCRRV